MHHLWESDTCFSRQQGWVLWHKLIDLWKLTSWLELNMKASNSLLLQLPTSVPSLTCLFHFQESSRWSWCFLFGFQHSTETDVQKKEVTNFGKSGIGWIWLCLTYSHLQEVDRNMLESQALKLAWHRWASLVGHSQGCPLKQYLHLGSVHSHFSASSLLLASDSLPYPQHTCNFTKPSTPSLMAFHWLVENLDWLITDISLSVWSSSPCLLIWGAFLRFAMQSLCPSLLFSLPLLNCENSSGIGNTFPCFFLLSNFRYWPSNVPQCIYL